MPVVSVNVEIAPKVTALLEISREKLAVKLEFSILWERVRFGPAPKNRRPYPAVNAVRSLGVQVKLAFHRLLTSSSVTMGLSVLIFSVKVRSSAPTVTLPSSVFENVEPRVADAPEFSKRSSVDSSCS